MSGYSGYRVMRPVGFGAAMLGLACAGAARAQPQVQVEHAAARLVVIAEPRADVSVTVQHGPSRLPPLQVRREGGRIVVDGGLQRPDGNTTINCVGGRSVTRAFSLFGHPVEHLSESRGVVVPGVARVEFADLPVITAHVPLDASVASSGAVWGDVGPTHSLTLAMAGCGDWTSGSVQTALVVNAEGSADLRAGDAGHLALKHGGSGDISVQHVANGVDVESGGSGDIVVQSVQGPLRLAVGGSGDVTLARLDGSVRVAIGGSGQVRVKSGRAPDVQVQVGGSGGFDFNGVAGRLQAAVAGSGDVHVAHVTGPVSKSVAGSGEVRVGP